MLDNSVFRELFGTDYLDEFVSGVFSDELDKLGLRGQVSNRWVQNRQGLRCFGRVRTLTLETVESPDERIAKGLGFLSSLAKCDVLLVKGSPDFAYFGELMSRLSVDVGLAGVIVDGLTRDSFYTSTIDLPVFARGYSPRDIKGRGRVAELDVAVDVDGIGVRSFDYVFGDSDALVFLPKEVLSELKGKVCAAVAEEGAIKREIAEGLSIAEILKRHHAF